MSRITNYFTPIGQGCLVLSVSNVDINLFVANKFQTQTPGMGMGTGMGTGLSSGLGGVGLGGGGMGMGTGAGIGTGGVLINSEIIIFIIIKELVIKSYSHNN